MSGEIDYLLRIVVPDIAPMTGLQAADPVGRTLRRQFRFAMERIKYTTALPVTYAE